MKTITTIVIIRGAAVFIASALAWAKSQAASAFISSNIAELRHAPSTEQVQRVEENVNRSLKEVRESFKPMMWLGCITGVVGVAGLIWSCTGKRKQTVPEPSQA